MRELLLMVFGHYLGDFALQNDFVAKEKVPGRPWWIHVMTSHCAVQGLVVYVATGSVTLMAMEFVAHFLIDVAKCLGYIGFTTDQLLHLGCKVIWGALLFAGLLGCGRDVGCVEHVDTPAGGYSQPCPPGGSHAGR